MQILKPLQDPPIARLWTGQALSAVGDQLHRIALTWLVIQLAGAAVGLVTAAECAAVLATAFLAGAWTERWDPRRTMIASDLVRGGLALVPLVALAVHVFNIWFVVLPSLGIAALRGVFDPALQSSLPRLARQTGRLHQTNALMDATARLARLVGPGIAGLLAGIMSIVGLMALNGFSFAVSALAVASLRRDLPRVRRIDGPRRLELLARGLGAVRGRPLFIFLLWRSAFVNGLWTAAIWICVPLSVQRQHVAGFGVRGLGVVALIMGAYGVGNLLSNLVVSNLRMRRPFAMILSGNVLLGFGLIVMGCAVEAPARYIMPVMLFGSVVTALGGPLTDIPTATLRQVSFPLSVTAAVYRLFMAAEWGGILLATAATPVAFAMASPLLVMIGCGAGILGTVLAGVLCCGRELGIGLPTTHPSDAQLMAESA